jgi:hypothetical protein
LQNVKKEDNKAEKRAQFFLNEGAPVRKGGTVDKKDISKIYSILIKIKTSCGYDCRGLGNKVQRNMGKVFGREKENGSTQR